MAVLILSACGGEDQRTEQRMQAYQDRQLLPSDSMMTRLFSQQDYQRALVLADSFEQCGAMSTLRADYYRGSACLCIDQNDKAKTYFRRVTASTDLSPHDVWLYQNAGVQLAKLLYGETNFEGALREAMPVLAYIDSIGFGLNFAKTELPTVIGCCQLNLGQPVQAKDHFERTYQTLRQWLATDSTGRAVLTTAEVCEWITDEYLAAHLYQEAKVWSERTDAVIPAFIRAFRHRDPETVDNACAGVAILRVLADQGIGHEVEARQTYDSLRATPWGSTAYGKIRSADYLMAARRYAEAADCYAALDSYLSGDEYTLEQVKTGFIPKLRANLYAGRKDSALYVARQITEFYDSALTRYKRSEAAELATVYDTQGKERKIAEQQADLLRQRLWGIAGALVLIVFFFLAYDLHRRRARRQLAAAHADLETAYDKLEETTAAKERIESELRIARGIQMSMVPSSFPDCDGLDLYAEMTPAKEVGGDLYGYVLDGARLYFCVGDVSGKGVPASLFMAQTARLFQTFAKEGIMPADMATRMNRELAENNERGMFVTMFIGLADLDTGSLDYCNCGHNPPVVDGTFLQMAYQNLPLGLWEDYTFQGERMEDVRNRRLLIYTDGLNEAMNPANEQFGDERLMQLMQQAASLNAHQVIDMLSKAVAQFRDGAEPNDDLTLMALCVKPFNKS